MHFENIIILKPLIENTCLLRVNPNTHLRVYPNCMVMSFCIILHLFIHQFQLYILFFLHHIFKIYYLSLNINSL